MVQAVKYFNTIVVFSVFGALIGLFGCSGCASKKVLGKPEPFVEAENPADLEVLWSKKFPGPITDLNLSKKGNALLVATIPDADEGTGRYLLTKLTLSGSNGKTVKSTWSHPLKTQIKSQSISSDGDFVVTMNYISELSGMNAQGKILWTVEASCRPIILNEAKKILCQHDDDTKAEAAFDVYGWDGKQILSFPVSRDLLALKVSEDEKNIVLGLTGGKVMILNDQFKAISETTVKGEILDLAISNGDHPKAAVLYHSKKEGQNIAFLTPTDGVKLLIAPGSHVEQIEISPNGQSIYVYGNSPKGQYISLLDWSLERPKLKWQRSDIRYADYSSAISVSDSQVLVGFENIEDNQRQSHMVVFDTEGKMKANLPLHTAEGAYLYSFSVSSESSTLATAGDDSVLTLLKMTK